MSSSETPNHVPNWPAHVPTWIADHLRDYLATDGKNGHLFDASALGAPAPVPTLLLTTTGRRSGKPFLLPLFYGEANGGYIVIGSKGGAAEHPAWYLNLQTNPDVGVQILAHHFRAKARTATDAERTALWEQMLKIYPAYADYQRRTPREIPVVVLDPIK